MVFSPSATNIVRVSGEFADSDIDVDAYSLRAVTVTGPSRTAVTDIDSEDKISRWRASVDQTLINRGGLDQWFWSAYAQNSDTDQVVDEVRATTGAGRREPYVGATQPRSSVTVLITGESGTGKELVARALHAASPRAARPCVCVNIAALNPQTAVAELFGHARGSFTGAFLAREGYFREADGGTIFLDELGELPLEVQPKLLRALAERRIKSVGGNTYREVDVRDAPSAGVPAGRPIDPAESCPVPRSSGHSAAKDDPIGPKGAFRLPPKSPIPVAGSLPPTAVVSPSRCLAAMSLMPEPEFRARSRRRSRDHAHECRTMSE